MPKGIYERKPNNENRGQINLEDFFDKIAEEEQRLENLRGLVAQYSRYEDAISLLEGKSV